MVSGGSTTRTRTKRTLAEVIGCKSLFLDHFEFAGHDQDFLADPRERSVILRYSGRQSHNSKKLLVGAPSSGSNALFDRADHIGRERGSFARLFRQRREHNVTASSHHAEGTIV